MFSTFFILCIGLLAVTRPSESQKRGGPRVVTQPGHFEADAGTSITLPCDIRNVGRRSVFWFKGDAPDGRELLMQMKSVKGTFTVPRQYEESIASGKLGTDGSNLIINNLDASDQDTYTCSIAWARQAVTHTLTVLGAAPLEPAPQLYLTTVPSDGKLSVGEGLPASLSCVASGSIPATVTWYKEGNPGVITVGNVFNLFETSREDTGRYLCLADNGVSEPVSFYFDLGVEYVEVQATTTEVVASGEDMMAQLSCYASGFPVPQIAWYSASGPVAEDDRHHTFSQDDTHFLQITQMTSADLGEYQCYGYNEKSRGHATISVSAAPGPVTVLGVTPSPSGNNRYTVSWEVNSLAPVNFYYVALKEGNSDSTSSSSVAGSSVPYDGRTLYRASTEFDMTPGETYEIMIKAVAEEYQPGPDQREPYVFYVPYGQSSSYGYTETRPRPQYTDTRDRTESTTLEQPTDDEDAWKWWKVAMTVMSNLPRVARVMQ
ncbi:protein amalgam-like [Macrobrachium rosenbergii]|uniref:protein amalgam-like n=1 Tax=Macrobrachium rosenbergii TaxID=79674 RepID=UPI0034D4774F